MRTAHFQDEESGYRASAVARSLVTRQTRTVGTVVTTIADPFAAGVVSGIEEAANELGYSVFLANSDADPDREVHAVRSFEERRVDGIIVTSSRVGAVYISMIAQLRMPIVLLNNQHPSEFVHSVMIANADASQNATALLIKQGHRQIAYVGDRQGGQSDSERFSGYRQAWTERAGVSSGIDGSRRRQTGGRAESDGATARAGRKADGGFLLQRHDGAGSTEGDSTRWIVRSRRHFADRLRRFVYLTIHRTAADNGASTSEGDGTPWRWKLWRSCCRARNRRTA